ncbi:DUF5683 domain-containing protein [Halolamina sp. C58]|uniref:DUF5683 domain-containing protein n=1 Tax=Halolamina sp. C58 TaxID=3421640 RepID=UPI003EBEBBE5
MSDDGPHEAPSTDEIDEPAGDDRTTPGEGEVYCRDCGAIIREKAEICPECGVRQQSPGSSMDELIETLTNGENAFVAAVYSAILPGLGQFYNREPAKGAAIVVASFVAMLSVLALVGFVLYPAVWLYAVYDAYVVAEGREPPLEI